jgi:trimeric autotransporter adhesin
MTGFVVHSASAARTRRLPGRPALLQGGRLASLLISLAVSGLAGRPAFAQVLDTKLWGTGGNVSAIARSGNTLYIAGALGEVGPNTGGGVPLSASTAAPDSLFPKVTGYVYAAVPDLQGGWYIGGDFTAVGGLPRSSLAHILRDGSVASWAPSQDDHNVFGLALSAGTLYVAGAFSTMDGQPRQSLAAFDAATGQLLAWDPHPTGEMFPYLGPIIRAVLVLGDTVFIAGNFTAVGGQSRSCLAALDATSGEALAWYPGAPNSEIWALASRGSALYLGGRFTVVAGQVRRCAAAVDVTTGAVLPWNPNVTGPDDAYGYAPRVMAIGAWDNTVFLGGVFSSAGGQPRAALAAVDADSGSLRPWNPGPAHAYSYPPPYVRSLGVRGDTLYVGGNFEMIGGADRISLAAVDINSGVATSWNPRPNFDNDVYVLATSDGVVYAGGTFVSMGPWQERHCLAAIDLTTGAVKVWNPDPNGILATAIVVSEGKVYVAGDFTSIGGQPRVGIAALDTLTGAALPWNPGTDNWIDVMAMGDGVLYVGGQFWNVGGQPRRYAAALDTATGMATAWNPNPDDAVTALAASGQTVYLGGWFRQVGGEPRASLAAVDAATGAIKPWRADCDGPPEALVVGDSTVFVGGQYLTTFNGQPRTDLAALDATTGAVKPWDPQLSGSVATPSPSVNALALSGHTLYVGGDFYSIGGQVRPCLAALDDSVGLATDWAPRPDFPVRSLAISGNILYAGGIFGAVGLLPAHGIAALSIPTDLVMIPHPLALAQNYPNPARYGTTIRFALPTASVVSLSVYDVQGRCVATPLVRSPQTAGFHDVPLQLGSWSPGIYLYRLEAGSRSLTRKMVLVK